MAAGAMPWSMPPPWLKQWQRGFLAGDLSAGVVVAVMLVPQSLAYAMLAGLPPQVGLLASLLPLLAYALFGSSGALSVGPAAITSLMVAQVLAPLAAPGSAGYVAMACCLALGSGVVMLLMGWMRLGFLSQLLSRPVVQGFTVASAILILLGQMAPLLGWAPIGHTLPDMAVALAQQGQAGAQIAPADATLGGGMLLALWLGRHAVAGLGGPLAWSGQTQQVLTRLWPLLVLVLGTVCAAGMTQATPWHPKLVGALTMPQAPGESTLASLLHLEAADWPAMLVPALLIGLVSFVSSMSVAQTFALKHGERIDADRELLGLGLANVGAAVLGGMPVAGGLSRSVVNEAAGARSPLAGLITAAVLLLMLMVLMPWLTWLPKAGLAAVIIAAVAGLISLAPWRAAWHYDRAEAWAFASTAAGVLLVGFEAGILLGMAWSLGAMVWRHSQPHVAEVGRLPGTQHFRNVSRYQVEVQPGVAMIRVDESLDFTNIQRVEQSLCGLIHARAQVKRVVLLLSAVNHIDFTAMQALEELDTALAEQGKTLFLAEIKGPVMDRLQSCAQGQRFRERIFLSAQQAWDAMAPAG